MKPEDTVLIELFRYDDSAENEIFAELLELQKYLALRMAKNKELEYYIVSYNKRGSSDKGVVIIIRGKPQDVNRESELLIDYINSKFNTITCKKMKTSTSVKIEIPIQGNFY